MEANNSVLSLFQIISTMVAIMGEWAVWGGGELRFFPNEEEAWKYYETFPEEGDVPEDEYTYAALYDPTGKCRTENT